MSDETPLAKLQRAVQDFANETSEKPSLVGTAVVLWESVSYNEEGTTMFKVDYASCGAQESMTSALGLVVHAQATMTHDMVHGTSEDDD